MWIRILQITHGWALLFFFDAMTQDLSKFALSKTNARIRLSFVFNLTNHSRLAPANPPSGETNQNSVSLTLS